MLLCFQVLGCCLLFFLLVRCAVKNDGLNCIYFSPQAYIDEAQKRGLTEKDTAMKRGKRFTLALCLFLLIVLDRLWVSYSKIWPIQGYGRRSPM